MATITVHNSLKPGAPVPFVPREEGKVSWYACGPTTYDLSHLGHARNYVSTDIIRRILMHHFGFKVKFVVSHCLHNQRKIVSLGQALTVVDELHRYR
jgi:cysteinyl-tRNA synthetase